MKEEQTASGLLFSPMTVTFDKYDPLTAEKEAERAKRNEIAFGEAFWENFEYLHHIIGQNKLVRLCTHKCINKYKWILEYHQGRVMGVMDFENHVIVGEHTQPCAVSKKFSNLDTYA